jgi:hypothetical protein
MSLISAAEGTHAKAQRREEEQYKSFFDCACAPLGEIILVLVY